MNKIWIGTTSVYATDSNWRPISIRNATYRWLASGSGTSEYYLDLAGGGDPGISEPTNVQENGTNVTAGTAGSLAAGRWDYADNDTLGYSTIYLRLAGSTDPDASALDYVTFTQPPVATDHVVIPAGSGSIAGSDQSGVAIGNFIVEDGYTGTIGSSTVYLRIDPDLFRFEGQGISYIDFTSAAISPEIRKTSPAAQGVHGLHLKGSAIATLNVMGGDVAVACQNGEVAAITTARCVGFNASLTLGSGVTVTTVYATAGKVEQRCASTTTTVYGGEIYTRGVGAITTMNVRGGNVYPESTGTITTLNADGGTTDFTKSGAARAVTTLKRNPGCTVKYDPAVLTVTTQAAPDYPVSASFAKP